MTRPLNVAAVSESLLEALEPIEGNVRSAIEELDELVGSVVLEIDFPGLGERVKGARAWLNGTLDLIGEAKADA